MSAMATIEDFLQQRRFALVGLSRDDKDLSRTVFRTLRARGYDVVPVNRHGGDIDGVVVHTSLAELTRRADASFDGVIVMVPPDEAATIVAKCAAARIPRVWLHRGAGRGSVSAEAVNLAGVHGLKIVAGECPLMFVGGGVHAAHGALRRATGHYPSGGTQPAPRRWRVILAVLQILVGLNAVVAGAAFVIDPSGALLGMSTAWLEGSPFSSFLLPGIVLFLVNGVAQLASAVLVLRAHRLAPFASLAVGAALCGWIVVQVLAVSEVSWLQPTLFAIGVGEIVLALALVRRAPRAA